jgi:manganese/iron transport system ATP-binding protein
VDTADPLRVTEAGLGYRGAVVLREVDFALPAGQILALIGANGSGKSTLIKAVLGLADVVTGSVEVHGPVAYTPQLDTLDPDFPISVRQVVGMGRLRGTGWWRTDWWRPAGRGDRAIAADALDRVGLAARARDRFGVLSGGQRQRVLIARAIAARPRLLLLDEPFNGVDAESRVAILEVLHEMTAAGTAILVSTHDLDLARYHADLVLRLNDGRQATIGVPA